MFGKPAALARRDHWALCLSSTASAWLRCIPFRSSALHSLFQVFPKRFSKIGFSDFARTGLWKGPLYELYAPRQLKAAQGLRHVRDQFRLCEIATNFQDYYRDRDFTHSESGAATTAHSSTEGWA